MGRVDLEEVAFGIFDFEEVDGFIRTDGGGESNGILRFWRVALAKFIVLKLGFSRSNTSLAWDFDTLDLD